MKYLIVGTGGTGACIGGFLAQNNHDVTFIARGKHLEAINENGLTINSDRIGKFNLKPVKAMTTEQYLQTNEIPDVIFISVKGYALDDIIPFLAKVSKENTIIIPILNIYGTGYRLAPKLPHTNVFISLPIFLHLEKYLKRVIFSVSSLAHVEKLH